MIESENFCFTSEIFVAQDTKCARNVVFFELKNEIFERIVFFLGVTLKLEH